MAKLVVFCIFRWAQEVTLCVLHCFVDSIPTMQFWTGIFRNKQSKSISLSFTDCARNPKTIHYGIGLPFKNVPYTMTKCYDLINFWCRFYPRSKTWEWQFHDTTFISLNAIKPCQAAQTAVHAAAYQLADRFRMINKDCILFNNRQGIHTLKIGI